jgi:hypothetical protein
MLTPAPQPATVKQIWFLDGESQKWYCPNTEYERPTPAIVDYWEAQIRLYGCTDVMVLEIDPDIPQVFIDEYYGLAIAYSLAHPITVEQAFILLMSTNGGDLTVRRACHNLSQGAPFEQVLHDTLMLYRQSIRS